MKLEMLICRIWIAAAITAIILSSIFAFIPGAKLTSCAVELAKELGDPQRIASAGLERVWLEFSFILRRIKLVLPVISVLMLIWGAFWFSMVKMKGQVRHVLAKEKNYPEERLASLKVIFTILAVSFFLRLINFNQSLCFDEILSFNNSVGAGFLKALTHQDHILYALLARSSILIFGVKEWSLRLPSLIFALAGIWFVAKFAGLFKNKTIVLISLLLLAVSPSHIDQSSQARGYAGLVFFTVAGCYFFMLALKYDRKRFWLIFSALILLGLYNHLYMLLVLISQAMVVILGVFLFKEDAKNKIPLIEHRQGARFFLYSTISLVLAFILYLPIIPQLVFDVFRNYPPQKVSFNFLALLVKFIGSGEQGMESGVVYAVLFISGLVFMWRKEKTAVLTALSLCVLPLGLNFLIQPNWLFTRFFIFILPVYLVFIACGIQGISKKVLPSKAMFVSVVLTAFLIFFTLRSNYEIFTTVRQDYRQAARFIENHNAEDSVVIAPGLAGFLVSYYLKDHRVIRIKTIAEAEKILKEYPRPVFLLTYRPTIDTELLKFIEDNYELIKFYPGRLSSIAIYG